MTKSGKFNTDSKALVNRIQAHNKFGTNDLNQWIFDNLSLKKDSQVLDLGCGTGKQTISIAEKIGQEGTITSVDLSDESLSKLREKASELGVSKQITTIKSSLDNIYQKIKGDYYDNVVSSYALYYCSNAEQMLTTIFNTLKPGGVVFFCGPSKHNNSEIKEFHYLLSGQSPKLGTFASEFMENTSPELVEKIFGNIEITKFSNPLKFDSPDSLYEYWSSYNLYEESLDSIFKEKAIKHFQENSFFETVKRVVGIKAVKKRT